MAVTITVNQVADQDTNKLLTANAATADTADLAEVFTVTPTVPGFQTLMRVHVAAANGAVAYSIAKGVQFGAAGAAETGSFAVGDTVRTFDSSRFLNADGAMVITFTPASGKKLLTDHALSVEFIQMPF